MMLLSLTVALQEPMGRGSTRRRYSQELVGRALRVRDKVGGEGKMRVSLVGLVFFGAFVVASCGGAGGSGGEDADNGSSDTHTQ